MSHHVNVAGTAVWNVSWRNLVNRPLEGSLEKSMWNHLKVHPQDLTVAVVAYDR